MTTTMRMATVTTVPEAATPETNHRTTIPDSTAATTKTTRESVDWPWNRRPGTSRTIAALRMAITTKLNRRTPCPESRFTTIRVPVHSPISAAIKVLIRVQKRRNVEWRKRLSARRPAERRPRASDIQRRNEGVSRATTTTICIRLAQFSQTRIRV